MSRPCSRNPSVTPPHQSPRDIKRATRYAARKVLRVPIRHRAASIASDPTAPVPMDDPALFDRLQNAYQGIPEYGYTALNTWQRGVDRAAAMIREIDGLETPGKHILDIGAGDGMTAAALASFGHHVTIADLEDWRDERAKSLAFIQADLSDPAALPDNEFDVVCSFNALEHITDPGGAFEGAWGALRPGGKLWLKFGPQFASPWGLHAHRMIRFPYPQFLFSEDYIRNFLATTGVKDLGQDREELQPLNRWTAAAFRKLWDRPDCRIVRSYEQEIRHYLDFVVRFPKAFRGRGLSLEDFCISDMFVHAVKESQAPAP